MTKTIKVIKDTMMSQKSIQIQINLTDTKRYKKKSGDQKPITIETQYKMDNIYESK